MSDLEPVSHLVLLMLGVGVGLLVVWWAALPHRPHHYGGAYGIPGGLERWQHSSYRWRRGVEAAALMMLAVILAPQMVAVAELVAGAGLMALGLSWFVWPARRGRQHHSFDVLALLLAVVPLVEARKLRR